MHLALLAIVFVIAACGDGSAALDTGTAPAPSVFRALGAGTDGRVTGLAFDGTTLYVGGRFSAAGGLVANHVARWDGRAWSEIGAGVDGEVATLALDPAGVPHVATFRPNLRVHRWDGAAWPDLAGGPPDAAEVFELAFDPMGRLYAPGRYAAARLPSRVARWDGAAWQDFGPSEPPPSGRAALAIAFAADGTVYASFDDNEADRGRVVRWDGAAWQDLGGDLNGSVHALVFDPTGVLHAGGSFTRAGDTAAGGVARWDGAAWQALGGSLGIESDQFGVLALAFGPDGSLYAGGDITSAEGVPTRGLARWDGTKWHATSVGPFGRVWTLAVGRPGEVYVGGEFHVVRSIDLTGADLVADNIVLWSPTATMR